MLQTLQQLFPLSSQIWRERRIKTCPTKTIPEDLSWFSSHGWSRRLILFPLILFLLLWSLLAVGKQLILFPLHLTTATCTPFITAMHNKANTANFWQNYASSSLAYLPQTIWISLTIRWKHGYRNVSMFPDLSIHFNNINAGLLHFCWRPLKPKILCWGHFSSQSLSYSLASLTSLCTLPAT